MEANSFKTRFAYSDPGPECVPSAARIVESAQYDELGRIVGYVKLDLSPLREIDEDCFLVFGRNDSLLHEAVFANGQAAIANWLPPKHVVRRYYYELPNSSIRIPCVAEVATHVEELHFNELDEQISALYESLIPQREAEEEDFIELFPHEVPEDHYAVNFYGSIGVDRVRDRLQSIDTDRPNENEVRSFIGWLDAHIELFSNLHNKEALEYDKDLQRLISVVSEARAFADYLTEGFTT